MTQPHPQPDDLFVINRLQMLELTKCCHSELLDILEDVYEHPATHTPAAPATEPEDYLEKCKKGLGNCPPQCMTSSGCPNLNINSFDGDPETYPQDTFCKCPYRKKPHDAAIRKDEREKMLEEICEPATDENKKDGWKLNVKWLVDIHRNIRNEGDNLCLEDIESVLLALKESLRGGAP